MRTIAVVPGGVDMGGSPDGNRKASVIREGRVIGRPKDDGTTVMAADLAPKGVGDQSLVQELCDDLKYVLDALLGCISCGDCCDGSE